MTRVLAVSAGLAAFLLLPVHPAAQAQEKPRTEEQKIETLIKLVEGLKDAKFVRNDQEHDAETAAKFLRGKWEAAGSKVKTAKDFVEQVASSSSTTGKPYRIRFADGKEMKSGEYFLAELRKLEKADPEPRGR